MLITIRVPDNTVNIRYDTKNEDGRLHVTHDVDLSMIVRLESEDESSRGVNR